jgi:hypothetical protein
LELRDMPTETPMVEGIQVESAEEMPTGLPQYNVPGVDSAIAEIELQESELGLSSDFEEQHLVEFDVVSESANLADRFPDLIPALDTIVEAHGLADAALITPAFLKLAADAGLESEQARRAKLGIKSMSREQFSAEVEKAYAVIDESAEIVSV